MKKVPISEEMDIRKITEKYRTSDPDEFLEVNCFHCRKNNLKLTPEACLSEMMLFILLSPEERDFFSCTFCKNNLIEDYSRVLRKRAEKRNFFVDESQLTEILKEFLRSNIASLIARYGVDEETVRSLFRKYFDTLL